MTRTLGTGLYPAAGGPQVDSGVREGLRRWDWR
jgi:hypothetical protein